MLIPGCGGTHRERRETRTNPRPNIVLVLTDDLSTDLVPYMPAVQALAARGTTFSHYFVTDSLCCPSRSSLFTGRFPHDTGIFSNTGSDGGFVRFHNRGEEGQTFAVALHRVGYRTALMGKYLNGYLEPDTPSPVPESYVPPGWDEWDVAGWGYPEFDYLLNHDGQVEYLGHRPRDYLTDVLARRGAAFIDRVAGSGHPFFLELATFAPHEPYVPAPRDDHLFPGLTAPRPPNFDAIPTSAPRWLAGQPPLTPEQIHKVNRAFRRRVRAVQSVDAMITTIERALAAHQALGNTLIVFSSDNGLHTGEYRLLPGKLTAFDTDIRVPLIAAGPGVPHRTISAMVENVDLAETFTGLAGAPLRGDGRSLVGLLHGGSSVGWRNAILVEHHSADFAAGDPDIQGPTNGHPTSYEAMRAPSFLYVEYRDGEHEFYDLRRDPFELHNVFATLPPARRRQLHAQLAELERCHTAPSCWTAAHLARPL